MTTKGIANILHETAELIELVQADKFRARAYASAGRALELEAQRLGSAFSPEHLKAVPGIGKAMAEAIRAIAAAGTCPLREALLAETPAGVRELLKVRGLGPSRIGVLWRTHGIDSVEALAAAAASGRLASLPGFGKRSAETLLGAAEASLRHKQFRLYAHAYPVADHIRLFLREATGAADFAGSLRRKMETVEALAFVALGPPERIAEALRLAEVEEVAVGPEAVTGRAADGLPVRVTPAAPEAYGLALWQETGSDAFRAAWTERFGAPEAAPTERALFRRARVAYVEPEQRESASALAGSDTAARPRLVAVEDLRGILHCHSTYSDGAHSLAEMAAYTRACGYEYFGVCDHSASLAIANGLSAERVREQQAEIAALNAEAAPFRIFSGTECDILAGGRLDYPDAVLASFDFVVASVHQGMEMDAEAATARIVAAVAHPCTTMLGHPTGRLLLKRDGYPVDLGAVIEACARHDVAIEVNANPRRLDLDWRWIGKALEAGVMLSINPDAHSAEQIELVRWGVEVARKGGLTPDRCLNAWPREAFAAWLLARRRRKNLDALKAAS